MNKTLIVTVVLLSPCLLPGQEKASPSPSPKPAHEVTHLVRLQHADPRQVAHLISLPGDGIVADDVLRAVVVSGTPDRVASMEQTIHEIDSEMGKMSTADVQLTIYAVGGFHQTNRLAEVPAGLRSTVDQLKAIFPYPFYGLLDVAIGRTEVGQRGNVDGTLPSLEQGAQPPVYHIAYQIHSVRSFGSKTSVDVSQFVFDGEFPARYGPSTDSSYQMTHTAIRTDFDIAPGQKIVLGKAGFAGDSALFLIAEVKVMDEGGGR